MKKVNASAIVITAVLCLFIFASCGQTKKIQRVSTDTVTDVSGRWNDTDSQETSKAMIDDCLSFPWVENFMKEKDNAKPVVIVGDVLNKSMEHINSETFTKDLERAFIRSGKVRVVSNEEFRNKLRKEKGQQAEGHTDSKTAASIGNEMGANFMLFGTINTIVDESGGTKVVFYQVNLELHDLTTTEKVWIGDKKIKKVIERAKSTW